jgi:hypothetical protein
MPKELEPGVLYVSEEFGAAAHLCGCGCGAKIRTPLGPTEWTVKETSSGPTLQPSIGNWQQPCQSHYWIKRGEIHWAPKWSAGEIADGRRSEERKREKYYRRLENRNRHGLKRLSDWIRTLFRR